MSERAVSVRIYTIGAGGKSAREFFGRLKEAGVRRVADIRLFNTSQLAGFSKKGDLEYFLKQIVGCGYTHLPAMAPTKELLEGYKRGEIGWEEYEEIFEELMKTRKIEQLMRREEADGCCFLCAEAKADRCHRRLVAEYLREKWGRVEIVHL